MTANIDELERTIESLLSQRTEGSTICPSEAARAASDDNWRDLMDDVRTAAQNLVEKGRVVVTQNGEVVDLAKAKGPIRIRRC